MDGEKFDSKAEADIYYQRVLLQKAGMISDLRRQVKYEFPLDYPKSYTADIVYVENGVNKVVDVKSPATAKDPMFKTKRALMKYFFSIHVEVMMK